MPSTGHWVYNNRNISIILLVQSYVMKLLLISLLLLSASSASAQPSTADIKKHKIKFVSETSTDQYGTTKRFWYYDIKGNDSLKSNFDDTASFHYTFKNGKLAEKRVVLSKKPDRDHVDSYTYEYSANGSYKETFRDGAYGMKSYTWYDARGKVLKTQSPDGNMITYKYNAAGKLMTVVSDGQNDGVKLNHKYTYNNKGQLIKKESEVDGTVSVSTYEYDAGGKLKKEIQKGGWSGEDSETIYLYEYNAKGLLLKLTTTGGEADAVKEYTYEFHR